MHIRNHSNGDINIYLFIYVSINIFVEICMGIYIYLYKLSQSIAFNLSNVFHYLKMKKQQQKQIKQRPAPKLLPYGVADIKFLCQWYDKTSFSIISLH